MFMGANYSTGAVFHATPAVKTRAKTKLTRLVRQHASKATRAFPVGDTQGIRLNPVGCGQGVL